MPIQYYAIPTERFHELVKPCYRLVKCPEISRDPSFHSKLTLSKINCRGSDCVREGGESSELTRDMLIKTICDTRLWASWPGP
ncbi:hypothetical protein Bpfe_026988 [Biomphalaria pfeifferi]|uniref:Uncharacterized protein n=1 Tax=Biomphalaria pfeifferi TaxID=112525 RepID=A0AAD8EX44_BIOPF|nr:hypothetical protein Bpfe_026988 [Biomphalaria pfeifferi]